MTLDEFNTEFDEIKTEYHEKKSFIAIKYAKENNPYKIGDIITGHHCTIKIDHITYSKVFGKEYAECVYNGPRLKKNLEPFKSGENDRIYQSNIEPPK